MNDQNSVEIPGRFWATLSPEEFSEVLRADGLNKEFCQRLWTLLGRTDECPSFLIVRIREATTH